MSKSKEIVPKSLKSPKSRKIILCLLYFLCLKRPKAPYIAILVGSLHWPLLVLFYAFFVHWSIKANIKTPVYKNKQKREQNKFMEKPKHGSSDGSAFASRSKGRGFESRWIYETLF